MQHSSKQRSFGDFALLRLKINVLGEKKRKKAKIIKKIVMKTTVRVVIIFFDAEVDFDFPWNHNPQHRIGVSISPPPTMPLVKIFARNTLTKPVPLAAIQTKLCNIWGTQPTKLILQRVEDWTDESFHEDVYVDIRAYGKTMDVTWWKWLLFQCSGNNTSCFASFLVVAEIRESRTNSWICVGRDAKGPSCI